jgi:hypothetical protein
MCEGAVVVAYATATNSANPTNAPVITVDDGILYHDGALEQIPNNEAEHEAGGRWVTVGREGRRTNQQQRRRKKKKGKRKKEKRKKKKRKRKTPENKIK